MMKWLMQRVFPEATRPHLRYCQSGLGRQTDSLVASRRVVSDEVPQISVLLALFCPAELQVNVLLAKKSLGKLGDIRAWCFRYESQSAPAREHVDQRRLAHVRAADDSKLGPLGRRTLAELHAGRDIFGSLDLCVSG